MLNVPWGLAIGLKKFVIYMENIVETIDRFAINHGKLVIWLVPSSSVSTSEGSKTYTYISVIECETDGRHILTLILLTVIIYSHK